MSSPPPKPPPQPLPPAGRYCDLVLQGGVVSGVVYPRAVARLAKAYWFHSLGGTSVGAVAAAVTAAAELGRRRVAAVGQAVAGRDGYDGFRGLDELPQALAARNGGASFLRSLFQPQPGLERLLELFVRGAGISARRKGAGLVVAGLATLLRTYWLGASIGIGVLAAAFVLAGAGWPQSGGWRGVEAGLVLLLALVCACVGSLLGLARDAMGPLVANGFGLCKLGDASLHPEQSPGLMRWLHTNLQKLANKPDDEPLTFDDLAQAPGGPGGGRPSIDLRMVTTNVTLARPWLLPLQAEEERLFFDPRELASYLPQPVFDALCRAALRYAPIGPGDPPASDATSALLELPRGKLPIVVAVRLSLSFPLLISALPLYAIDREPREPAERRLRRCWFSDGGICSNFPIHFFDAAVPQWPTFGIALGRRSASWPDQTVWLPHFHNQGRGDRWDGDDAAGSSGWAQLAGFAERLVTSAKDWNDRLLTRMPGVRDRVVRVGFAHDESEFDIGMPGEQIADMADRYGPPAARKLLAKFSRRRPSEGTGPGWREHRWVRFNTLLAGLNDLLDGYAAMDQGATPEDSLQALTQRAFLEGVLRGNRPAERKLSAAQANALSELRAALLAFERSLAADPVDQQQPYQPEPRGQLRSRPPL